MRTLLTTALTTAALAAPSPAASPAAHALQPPAHPTTALTSGHHAPATTARTAGTRTPPSATLTAETHTTAAATLTAASHTTAANALTAAGHTTAATALTGASRPTSADATGRTGVGTREAVAEGKYWHTRTLQVMTHPRQVGRGDNKYWLVERRLSETWTSRDGRAWTTFRRLGATPKSAADRAAWKRDGSPKKWSYRTEGMLLELSMEPEKGRVIPPRSPHGWFLGYTRLTFEELQAAPTDPSQLKTWLQKLYSTPGEPPIDPSTDLPSAYTDLMHRLPAPKAVRTAAYQLLSQMPGATVTDAGKGRKKVTERSERANTKTRHARIIDTRDLLLVGTELDTIHNGKQLNAKTWTMDVKSGWTNNEPAAS